MDGITHIENFIANPTALYDRLTEEVFWDERMTARKTASYGQAYNYSQITYPYQEMLPDLRLIIDQLEQVIKFRPNNCLINFYSDGKSKMGFHSDQTDILLDDTGIAIVSIGATRTLVFKKIANPDETLHFDLTSGSLIYMTQEVQEFWKHAIPKSDASEGRMSLTFRSLR